MNLRQAVEKQFGPKVIELLDRYAEIGMQAASDYEIDRHDRRELFDGQQLAIKQQLIELKGPIVTHRIHVASTQDRQNLIKEIDTFHDVDSVLEELFSENLWVQLDSESSELFVFSSEEMAPKVIAKLTEQFPAISWVSIPQPVDLSSLTVANSWPKGKEWLRLKYAKDKS